MSALAVEGPGGEMISLAEASRRSGIPYITLKRKASAGQIPGATKDGREWRIPYPLPLEITAGARRREADENIRPLPQPPGRWIGVVDTGLIEQLEQSRESERWLKRQLEDAQRERQRLIAALLDRGISPPA